MKKLFTRVFLCSTLIFTSLFAFSCNKQNELTKINIDNVVFDGAEYTYDGTEKKLEIANLPENVSINYSNNSLTNAGSINASATLSANEGYVLVKNNEELSQITLDASLKINPKTISASIENLESTDDVLTPVINIDGAINNEEIDFDVSYFPEEVKLSGNYTATITLKNSNYVLENNIIPFEVIETNVNNINIDNIIFEDITATYDGTEKKLEIANLPENVDVSYSENTLTNAGELEVTATLIPTEGYKLVYQNSVYEDKLELKAKIKIEPKEIEASIDTIYTTGEQITPEIIFKGLVDGILPEYDVIYSDDEMILAGDYSASITLKNNNYTLKNNVINFVLKDKIILQTPNFIFSNGEILVSLMDDYSTTWAYSYDNVEFIVTTADSVEIEGIGSTTVYVKAVAEHDDYSDSEVTSKTVYINGTTLEYDFSVVNDGKVKDLTKRGADLSVKNGTFTKTELVIDNKSTTGSVAYTPQSLAYDKSSSITVEVVARVDELVVPTSGERWYPIVFKTQEYFIGYWTVASEPNKARLCMVLFSGEEGDKYYNAMWFDDTNFWLPVKEIADNNFHSYAISYDKNTGKVNYYMDNILLGTGIRNSGEECRYTGNSIVLGGWGNLYDVNNNTVSNYSSMSYRYFKSRNYYCELSQMTDFSTQTSRVIVSGNDLTYAPSNNVSNLTYLNSIEDRPNYGSMTFSVSFKFNANDLTENIRYTVANRGESFQLYLIRANGHVFGQAYLRTTDPSNIYGQTFLDYGAIDEYVKSFGDGTTVNTIKITFDATTGRAKGQVNDVYIDWCYKDFGGTLINPSYTHNVALPLYIGSAAWGEAMPASTEFSSFELNGAPIDISLNQGYKASLTSLVNLYKEVDMSSKTLLIGASHFTLWYDEAAKDLAPEYDAVNFGVGGTNADFWNKNAYLLEELKNDPEYILLTIGGNIIEEDAVKNIDLMKEVMKKLAKIFPTSKICFVSIFDQPGHANSQWYTTYKDNTHTEIAKWVGENNIENDYMLDLREFVYDKDATSGTYYKEGYGYLRTDIFQNDNIHLNQNGLDLFAQAIKSALANIEQ